MNLLKYNWSWERIDTRLSWQFPYSRNFFHHIISRWGIKVWWKVVKKSYKLKNNDEIFIDDLKRYLSPIILEEAPKIEIPIILEKEDYMVINKPKWVLSHPNSVWEANYPSVVWFLYHNFKNLPSIGNFIRAGLIHRLDKDTDGLMIIAKTEKWLAHFKSLFQEKSEIASSFDENIWNDSEDFDEIDGINENKIPIRKFYRAKSIITVLGDEFLKKIEKQLPHYIQETVYAKVPNPNPKMWITKILDYKKEWDIVKLNLEILTGRTHQIRYHLSNHGLPIAWDYLYGTEENFPMQLTAYRLEFIDPEGEKVQISL